MSLENQKRLLTIAHYNLLLKLQLDEEGRYMLEEIQRLLAEWIEAETVS